MNKTTVVNKYHKVPYDTYIGRGSIWGNPFVIGKDGDRDDVIRKHAEWIQTQPQLMSRLHEIKGKRLCCYCYPKSCHGNTLATLADNLED